MGHSIKNFTNQIITSLCVSVLVVQPVLAQSIVAIPDGPQVIQTANGVTMVMIETPDANGVSHNVYVEFGIGPDGAILNNASTNTAITELGGIIQGNSNLAGGSASIILNEVTSNNPSVLNGFLEVGGQRADVIIANPYGITCDGCGFINTDRLTMATGTPTYQGDTFTGLSVDGGAINIGTGGLDASTTTQFDLISRQIMVAGAVQGQRIRVVAGRNDVIYATGEIIEKADDGSTAPVLAIDSTVLGGMYADLITITSTEDGVGVRAPANMAANAGAMRITADGRLMMGSASSVGNMVLESSDDIVIEGTVVSTQNIDAVSAEDLIIQANASLVADSLANLTIGNNLSLETGAEIAAGTAVLADITGAVAVANAADFISNGTFDMTAGSIDVSNGGTIAATGGALALDVVGDIQNSGLIFGNTALNLRSDAAIVNDGGALVSNGNLSISGLNGALAIRFTNQDGGLVETISGDIVIAAQIIENLRPDPTVDGTLVTSSNDLTGESCAPLCYDPLVIGSTVTLNGDAAQMISSGNITFVGDNFSNRFSLVSARGDITINVNTFENIGLNIYTNGASGLELVGAVFGTIEAAGTFFGVVSGYAQNDAVLTGVSGIGGSNIDVTGLDSGSIGNPNLLVVNVDPDATYLIETRPDFVDLDKFISSDYFLDAIQYDPALKRFGDAYAEALYIRQQLLALLGQIILDGAIDERAQIQAMYDNAINAMVNLDLSVGVALTPTQISALTTDIIWLEMVEVDGQMVLAPRVYLANPELRFTALGGAIISARNVAFYTGDFTNSGVLSAQESMVLNASNTFNSSGQISGNDISISANIINLSTQAVRVDTTPVTAATIGQLIVNDALGLLSGNVPNPDGTFTELAARPSSLVAGNTLVLRATNDLTMAGTEIEAGTSASFIAGGDIIVGALELASENGRKTGKNRNRIETLRFLTSSITSGGDMMFLSSGNAEGQNDIVFEGADIYAAGDIGMIAQGGDLVLASVENITFTDRAGSRGNFIYKKVSRDQVFDITNKLTSLTGQSITGVSALDLVIEGTTFDVPGLPDGSLRPGALALVSVNSGLTFTAPTDIRAESRYVSRKILGGLITNTKDLRTLVTESLGSIADVAGDLLINSGADLTLTSVEFDIGGQFSTEVAGATYMLAAIDMDYRFLVEHRDNGIFTTDIRSENIRERVTFNAITAAGGINFDENSPILFAGIRNPLIDAAHPGAWVAGDDTGRLNITEPFLGEENEVTSENEEGEYWRDGAKWSEEGKLNVLMASLPGAVDGAQFGYVDDLLARDSTVNQTIELLDYHFYEKKHALSPAFQVLVSIAVGNWVGGWGVWGVAPGATASASTLAMQSFTSSMITQTIAGVVSGELDFAKMLETAAFSFVTTYATASFDLGKLTDASNESWIGADNGLLSPVKILDGIGDEFITAGLNTAVYGTDFGDNLAAGLQSFAINQATSALQFGIGEIKENNGIAEGSFGASLLHGVVGCASAEAAGGNCASGFITAFGTEVASGYMGKGFEPDPNASAVEQEQARQAYAQQRAKMVGAALGYLTSGGNATNVSQGSFIARSAIENNRQLHTRELIAIREKAAELAGQDGLSEKEWLQRLTRAALVRTDRNWGSQFDGDDAAANAALDELIAAYGTSFEDELGRQLGFFNETNTAYFNNAMFNVQFIAANKAFFDEALEGWAPPKWEGLQELLSPSDIAYLSAIHAGPYMGARISPDGDAVEHAVMKRDQNLQMLAMAYELGRIKRQLATTSWDIMNASDDEDVLLAWSSASSYVNKQIQESAWAIRNAMLPGMMRGASDFFTENAAALAVLVYDMSAGGALDYGLGVGGSAERNQARIDGIVYLLSQPGEVPAAIVNQMKADMAEAGRLFEAGDLDGAARIMGRMQAGVLTATTGAAGAVQLTAAGARALAKITKTPITYRQINAMGAEVTSADLPTGFTRVAHPDGDIVIMAPDGRVYASVDEIPVGNRTLPSGYTRNADGTINGPGNPGGQQALFRETGQVDGSGNPILQRDSGSYFTIDAAGNQQRVAAGDLPSTLQSRGEAPWQQSQTYIQQQVGSGEKSYLDGVEVPHGTPGSVRPDAVLGCGTQCFEVKNYDLSSTSGQNSLVNTTVTQINQRTTNLPAGMQQEIRIDITGQSVPMATQVQIRNQIVRGSNGAVSAGNINFFVRD